MHYVNKPGGGGGGEIRITINPVSFINLPSSGRKLDTAIRRINIEVTISYQLPINSCSLVTFLKDSLQFLMCSARIQTLNSVISSPVLTPRLWIIIIWYSLYHKRKLNKLNKKIHCRINRVDIIYLFNNQHSLAAVPLPCTIQEIQRQWSQDTIKDHFAPLTSTKTVSRALQSWNTFWKASVKSGVPVKPGWF